MRGLGRVFGGKVDKNTKIGILRGRMIGFIGKKIYQEEDG
jgi:hypothetical protein